MVPRLILAIAPLLLLLLALDVNFVPFISLTACMFCLFPLVPNQIPGCVKAVWCLEDV